MSVKHWLINNQPSLFHYSGDAGKNYDRLTKNGTIQMAIVNHKKQKYILSKQDYINWMEEVAKNNKYVPLIHKVIVEQ